MPLALMLALHHAISIVKGPLHSIHQDNQNEEQHEFFGHVMQLPLPLLDATGVCVI